MWYRFLPPKMLFLGVVAAVLASCGTSPPVHMYTLAPMPKQALKPAGRLGENPVSVVVSQVELPDYLDRPQIVTRQGTNGLQLAEFHRWGGSLGNDITTVLVENLSGLLGSERVAAFPSLEKEVPDFRVAVRVLRLDCVPGDRVELEAQWVVMKEKENREVGGGLSTFTERVIGESYATLVTAVSRTVGQLSREIVQAITAPANTPSTDDPMRVRP